MSTPGQGRFLMTSFIAFLSCSGCLTLIVPLLTSSKWYTNKRYSPFASTTSLTSSKLKGTSSERVAFCFLTTTRDGFPLLPTTSARISTLGSWRFDAMASRDLNWLLLARICARRVSLPTCAELNIRCYLTYFSPESPGKRVKTDAVRETKSNKFKINLLAYKKWFPNVRGVVALHEPTASPSQPRVTSQPWVNHKSNIYIYFFFGPQKK